MIRHAVFFAAILAMCSAGQAIPAGPSDAQIKRLVAQLASPNPVPKIMRPDVQYDPKYNHGAQRKVREAWKTLHELAPRSFPFLFDHFYDDRYAMTEDAGDFDDNYSVGFLCRDVLVGNLQPDVWDHKDPGTAFRRRPHAPDYIEHFGLLDAKSARRWWQTRKDRSLLDLQVEVLQWVLKEEERHAKTFTDKDRKRIEKELAELKATRKPRKAPYPFVK